MFKLLFVSSSSACFELDNKNQFYSPSPYTLYLDNEKVREGNTNVFSLFGLKSNTEYNVTVEFPDRRESLIFRTNSERFAINVRDFGAVGDGIHDDTKAIRAALDFLPEGGRLYFPEGTYLTFPQAIRSHMTIEFAEGAVLKGSPDRARYQIIPGEVHDVESGAEIILGAFEGVIREMYQALLSAAYAEDITIIGPGTVDGNAGAGDFWTKFQEFGTARPRLFFFSHCKDIRIHGIHACNSASWQFHPFFSDRVSFYDVFISAPKDSPNTDAIDPESCDFVNIIGCRFSVGDDCIAIKSGKMDLGMRFKKPADHHVVRNCLMDFGHGAVTLGSEMSAGIRNLTVEQCYFRGTDRGLRIKTRRGRGKLCDISGVVFDNIRMEGVRTPVVMNMYYNCCDPDRYTEYVWSREHLPVDDRTPHLGSFHFYNLDCTDAEVAACYIDGLPEMPIDEVCFKDCRISFKEDAKPGVPAMENFAKQRCKLGLYLDNVKKIVIDNVKLEGVDGDEIIANHHEELIVK
ncbi:MAG: glycoside hydrolase family 28 protein [Anaerolineaceae bacterium]|nr:glycoside hydrolase family 28 protein [Anaerolineaceae bacterium]